MKLNKLGSGFCPVFRLAETRRLQAMLGLTVKGVITVIVSPIKRKPLGVAVRCELPQRARLYPACISILSETKK